MSYFGQTGGTQQQSDEVRVLHVDDQQNIVELSSEFLEKESGVIEVSTETTVQDALHRLASRRIDCIVSDYDMPGCDGLEFLEQIREDHGDIPFILYTGKGSEEIASKAISAGVTDYLQKGSGTNQYAVLANRIENAVQQYRSQRAVEATEQKLSQLAERTDDIFFMFDGEWEELLFVNSAYEDIWGGSVSELRENPRSFLDYVHPDDRDIAEQSLQRLQHGESHTVEYRVISGDGDVRWVSGETKPILDDGGELLRITGFVRDITEQRERERELERYKILVEEATDSIGVVSEDGTVQYQNPAIERILGYDVDTFEGSTVFEYMHPDDQADVMERFYELISDGSDQVDRVQYRIQHADGSWRWLESEASSRTDTALGGYVITSRDITERRERKQQLTQYEEIYDTIDDGVYVIDEKGHFAMVNDAYAEMFGYTREELLGSPASMIADEDTRKKAQQLDAEMRHDSAATQTIEADLPTADGDRLSFEAKFSLLPASDEQEHRVGVVRDISERKEREQKLQRQNERLNEFAGIVSHDLRNPLQVADGRLALAAEDCDSKHLDGVRSALNRMDELIEDLLTLAYEGKALSDLEPVALAAMVEDCWATVETGDATLATSVDCDIYADESQLKQALENLIRNTVEHGGDGVNMTIGELDDGFYFEDDGPGIPEDNRDDVFDAGFSTDEDGSGLGLSIVKRISEAHGWEIDITENFADGTRFEVTGVEFASE